MLIISRKKKETKFFVDFAITHQIRSVLETMHVNERKKVEFTITALYNDIFFEHFIGFCVEINYYPTPMFYTDCCCSLKHKVKKSFRLFRYYFLSLSFTFLVYFFKFFSPIGEPYLLFYWLCSLTFIWMLFMSL